MRALVTGASGFVGRYLMQRLADENYQVLAAGRVNDGKGPRIDLDDIESIHLAFDIAQPDIVFHLAAQTFVPRSIEAPAETYKTNVIGTATLLAALRDWQDRSGRNARLLFVSSAGVYGEQPAEAMPITEAHGLNPSNPYAASKAAAEAIILGEVKTFGVDAVIARAFNHIGPGQNVEFSVPAFAAQLAKIARGGEPVLYVGNLDTMRDFLDVRDVVDAYVALATLGSAGETYNVCSGAATSMREIVGELIRIAHVPVEVRGDAGRMRPADVPVSYGSNVKLRSATGWSPRIPLITTLRDVYNQYNEALSPR